MAETYCGKGCEGCRERDALNCPGCRIGPGSAVGGACDIAKCCRTGGHRTCGSCTLARNCGKLMGRQKMAERRLYKIKEETARKNRLSREAPVLGRWLNNLLWLIVLTNILSLLTADQVIAAFPAMRIPSAVIMLVTEVAYGAILLRLGDLSGRYYSAGLWGIVAAVLNRIPDFLGEADWTAIFVFTALIPALVGEYQECLAHAERLDELDGELADKWRTLWYWSIGSSAVLILSILLTALAALLGLLVMIAAAIVQIVVAVMKIVYIYRTARVFRSYRAD